MDKNKIIANELLKVVGGKPKVTRYWDSTNKKSIDVFFAKDQPFNGIITCASIGLSDHNIGLKSSDKKLRVELIGACNDNHPDFPNLLSTAAFEIIDKGSCNYGTILPRVIELYYPDAIMKHIYLMSPFLWDKLASIELSDLKVAWLLMVPISDGEMKYAMQNGVDELETLFEKEDINIFDLSRKSTI